MEEKYDSEDQNPEHYLDIDEQDSDDISMNESEDPRV